MKSNCLARKIQSFGLFLTSFVTNFACSTEKASCQMISNVLLLLITRSLIIFLGNLYQAEDSFLFFTATYLGIDITELEMVL